ncbi:MAG: hypothetical protein ABJ239_01245 [Erythrobacter sp.]
MIQFLGSLIAIAALAGLAWWLKLGRTPKLLEEQAAGVAAAQVEDGFDAAQIALDREGRAALVRGADNRLMVLKPHGSHFAGRVLTKTANMKAEGDELVVNSGERRFGLVRLRIDDAEAWVTAFKRVNTDNNA